MIASVGNRFSKVEDEVVKEAVLECIEAHCLGEEGLKMALNCMLYPEVRNCWKKIGTCLAIGLKVPSNIMLKFCFEGMKNINGLKKRSNRSMSSRRNMGTNGSIWLMNLANMGFT